MLLICGLGNYTDQYQYTRHNIGHMFIDYILSEYNNNSIKKKLSSLYIKDKIFNRDAIIAKNDTFMNLSGISIAKLSKYYNIKPNNIFIIHDDIDLKFGIIKSKIGGGNAGHNGLKDIDNHIGNQYHRIRIGVDHPKNIKDCKMEVSNYVLSNFSNEQLDNMNNIFHEALNKINDIITTSL